MSKLDLDAIEKRTSAATTGPMEVKCIAPEGFRSGGEICIHNGVTFPARFISEADAAFVAAAYTDVPLLVARVRELEAALERATKALNRDATGLARALVDVRNSAASRMWITEGRGPYEWNDDRYKEEAGVALREVIEIAVKGLRESGKIADVEVPAAQLVLGSVKEIGDRELDSPLPLAQNVIDARKKP